MENSEHRRKKEMFWQPVTLGQLQMWKLCVSDRGAYWLPEKHLEKGAGSSAQSQMSTPAGPGWVHNKVTKVNRGELNCKQPKGSDPVCFYFPLYLQ